MKAVETLGRDLQRQKGKGWRRQREKSGRQLRQSSIIHLLSRKKAEKGHVVLIQIYFLGLLLTLLCLGLAAGSKMPF